MSFTRKASSGLWVPTRTRAETDRQRSPYIFVGVGYSSLFGEAPGWAGVVERLRRYSLWQVLDIIGRASAVLEKLQPWRTYLGQALLCAGILGPRCQQVREALAAWVKGLPKETRPERPILFHDLQLLAAAKIALLELDPGQDHGESDFSALGEALLILNDLLDAEVLKELAGGYPVSAGERQRWHRYLLINGLFHAGDNPQHALARGYDLYLADRPHLRDCGSYMDLPALVREVTGFDPDLLWTILFAFSAHWQTLDPKAVQRTPGAINLETYLTAKCNFTREESEGFFSLVAETASRVGEQLRNAGIGPGSLRPFDTLPFADKPLVIVDSLVYCVSVPLLLQKVTRGLHYLFLNGIPEIARRNRYLTYMGEVFDDYVGTLLERAYPAASGRYVDGRRLRERVPAGAKTCDGAVIYPGTVILVETKATLFTAAVRATGEWEPYEAKMRDIFVDAAAQFEGTVSQIEKGRFRDLGLEPERIRAYLPLVVTLESVPMMKPIYDWVDAELRRDALLQHSKVKPMQAVDVADLEFLEVAVGDGRDVAELLETKTSSEETRHLALSNYCIERGEAFVRGINRYLAERFDNLGERALEIIRSHTR